MSESDSDQARLGEQGWWIDIELILPCQNKYSGGTESRVEQAGDFLSVKCRMSQDMAGKDVNKPPDPAAKPAELSASTGFRMIPPRPNRREELLSTIRFSTAFEN